MNQVSDKTGGNQARILIHSQRNLFDNIHYRLGLYEFEDIVRQIDTADLISPRTKPWFRYGSKLAHRIANTYPVGINPGLHRISVKKSYDLFFAAVQFPNDLLHISSVDGWRENCKTAICWLNEVWTPEIIKRRYFLKLLKNFDYVILQLSGSLQRIQEAINKPCVYMPYGIDTILFCPYPNPPVRGVDVYSIGRKAEQTHRTLLKMAEKKNMLYIYDTIKGEQVLNPNDHRLLFANISKRSRYFIANPSKPDEREETGGQNEFGARFFEGAASGTVMIGQTPVNKNFEKFFNWPDALINLPFGSEGIDKVIDELDKDPARQEAIRRNSIVQSLLRHDWTYRWEEILKLAGLKPMPELLKRKERLGALAKIVEEDRSIP